MKCKRCKREISDDSEFCNKCGEKIQPADSQKSGIFGYIQAYSQPIVKHQIVVFILLGVLLMTNESFLGETRVNIVDNFANVFIATGVIGIAFKLAEDSRLIGGVIEDMSLKYRKQMHDEIEAHLIKLDKASETLSVGIIKTSIKECTKECSDKMAIRYKLLEEADSVGLEHIFYRKTPGNRCGLDLLFSSIQEQINSKTGEIYIVGILSLIHI